VMRVVEVLAALRKRGVQVQIIDQQIDIHGTLSVAEMAWFGRNAREVLEVLVAERDEAYKGLPEAEAVREQNGAHHDFLDWLVAHGRIGEGK
jgi:hypothetical protein